MNTSSLGRWSYPAILVSALALFIAPVVRGVAPIDSSATPRLAGVSARDLLGRDVHGSGGEDLGDLKDLVVSSNDGKILYGLVSSGGVLGVGEKIRAVPFGAFTTPSVGDGPLTLDIGKPRWDSAPILRDEEFDLLAVESRGKSVFDFYQQDWAREMRPGVVKPAEQSFRLLRVAPLLGKDIRNAGQSVGKIEDVIVNLDTRRASPLIDADDEYVNSSEKFLISFSQVMLSPDKKETIATPLTRAEFAAAKPVRGDWWAAATGFPYVWRGYGYTEKVGYTLTSPATVGAAQGQVAETPPARTERTADERLSVDEVREALSHDAVLAADARRVILRDEGKKLVIRGTVPSKALREKIADRVSSLAKGWDVDDQMTVSTAAE
jgi:sporulation protein YlmC with PRC-barrel domain